MVPNAELRWSRRQAKSLNPEPRRGAHVDQAPNPGLQRPDQFPELRIEGHEPP